MLIENEYAWVQFILALMIIILYPIACGLGSIILDTRKPQDIKKLLNPFFVIINLLSSYIILDMFSTIITILMLYILTQVDVLGDSSPTTQLVRVGGILFLIILYSTQFPIKFAGITLSPILSRIGLYAEQLKELTPYRSPRTTEEMLIPWSETLWNTAHWLGLCLVVGAVMPYLLIILMGLVANRLQAALFDSAIWSRVLELILLVADWQTAVLTLLFMFYLSYLYFSGVRIDHE